MGNLALNLARIQFSVTTLFHFIFVPLTLGLAPIVAVMETMWFKTKNPKYLRMAKFWGTLLVINFAIGVVTGIVQEFQFGMNWAAFSKYVGAVFGAPLAMEGLFAFFLESTFIGLWLFGRDKLPRGVHLATMWLYALGTWLSAYFIMAANSWMQHPNGYVIRNGRAELTNISKVLFQNTAVWSFTHVILSSFLIASLFVIGVSAWHLKRQRNIDVMKWSFGFAVGIAIVTMVFNGLAGDQLAKVMTSQQPMKMAAAEALPNTATGRHASFSVLTLGDPRDPNVKQIRIPGLLAFMATGSFQGTVEGFNQIQQRYEQQYGPGNYIPNLMVAYWSFRIMIGFGAIATIWALFAWLVLRRKKQPKSKLFWTITIWIMALPWLGTLIGWVFTESARQPWTVFGLLKTKDAVSSVGSWLVWTSLIAFTLTYGIFAVVEFRLMKKYVQKGPLSEEEITGDPTHDADKLVFAY
jgi:cytochrome bd ubiquinol oxidase subunit I